MPTEPAKRSNEQSPNPAAAATLPHGLSKTQIIVALAIAGLSDVLSAFVTVAPPVAWGVDVVTVVLLFLVLGWNWLLLPGLVMEAIPGFGVFPFWCLVVAAIAVWGTARPRLRGESMAPIASLIEKLKSQK
jgi:MFS superfamily sulfate permease-like transporter